METMNNEQLRMLELAGFTNPKDIMIILESRNTLGADINEILLGYYCLGGTWAGFQDSSTAKKQLKDRQGSVESSEYVDQDGRARVMADKVLSWASSNGYSGRVKKVWWTARPGVLSKAVGFAVNSRENPTDTLLQFTDGKFLGLSAKSTKGGGDIGFKNPGIGTLDSALNINLSKIAQDEINSTIESLDLPKSSKARKEYIRSNPEIQKATISAGVGLLSLLRDKLFVKLYKMTHEDLLDHLLNHWMDAKIPNPYYIKVTGHGRNGNYSATILDPTKNPKVKALGVEDISLEKVGNESIGIYAGNKKIMKMRFKFESEKMASSIKLSGDPW